MPKLLIKSKDPSVLPKLSRGKKPGYELISVPITAPFDMLTPKDKEIHGIVVDADLTTPAEIMSIRAIMQDGIFPIVLVAGMLSEEEAGRWIGCGVTDVFQMPMPAAVMGRRMGSLIQLYCMAQSLYGQVTDKLTGLNNKDAFYHFAKEMMMRRPEDDYTIILSDIENFKRINERFGEEKGDALLRYVGGMLGKMQNEDILFARYSGDQFVGIMRIPKSEFSMNEDLMKLAMRKFYEDAPIEHFNVQFGLYEKVDKTLPISILCDRALMALKTIKHRYGRCIAKYSPQLQVKFNREQQINDTMEQALAEHQFQVYYQPKHDAATSEIIGAEALVRWNHPVYGFLSPAEFIPLFEKSGFITQVDEYVWDEVCRQMRGMLDQGLPVVPVSVNASRMDFARTGFVERMHDAAQNYGLDPELLHLELTESAYMEDATILAPILTQIKDLGFSIELDDFGSGFSSLGNISKLPVDVIKLDISFIRNLEAQPVIVEGIIHLMHTLGHKVIAEGVETDVQLEILRQMGCDYVQGYYYSKPLPLDGYCCYIAAHEQGAGEATLGIA